MGQFKLTHYAAVVRRQHEKSVIRLLRGLARMQQPDPGALPQPHQAVPRDWRRSAWPEG